MRRSLAQTLSGLSTAIQGICELRNQCGFASHGSEQPRPAMDAVQALMAAEAADTIVGFCTASTARIARRRCRRERRTLRTRLSTTLWMKSHGPIRIYEIELRASEVLFQMEPESYRIYAAEFDDEAGDLAGHADIAPEPAP